MEKEASQAVPTESKHAAEKVSETAKEDVQQEDDQAVQIEVPTCVVCWERESGAKVHPCGHDYFCRPCARRFRTCPLCRVPLTTENGEPWLALSGETVNQPDLEPVPPERQPVISSSEQSLLMAVCFGVWFFIFVGGYIEYMHNVPASCRPGDVGLPGDELVCKRCGSGGCFECADGYVNHGAQCFKYLESFPTQIVGAALGGGLYFGLIVVTQFAGVATELFLICRLVKRQLMPKKEIVILALALLIEISRMCLVDLFMLQDYFGGREYGIYRMPVQCDSAFGWTGADGINYCDDTSAYLSTTRYYVASARGAFSSDSEECTTWLQSDALLDFKTTAPTYPHPGSPRFENLGWIVGGEFALYYFFATFVNEFADCLFVVPTTTTMGWRCKIFSVALEVFQLGALAPAAIFTHGACLKYHDPLGVSLHLTSFIIAAFGYAVWGFLFFCVPLAGLGAGVLFALWLIVQSLRGLAFLCEKLKLEMMQRAVLRASNILGSGLQRFNAWARSSGETSSQAVMGLAFFPLLLSGFFLGGLVVIGQASKSSAMEVITALVLLSDVLLKVGATAMTETAEYLLHLRVRRAVDRLASEQLLDAVAAQEEPAQSNDSQEQPAAAADQPVAEAQQPVAEVIGRTGSA